MATIFYSYNTTNLYLSNSDLSTNGIYGTTYGYTCGEYIADSSSSSYNKSTCTSITILDNIQPTDSIYFFCGFSTLTAITNIDKLDTSISTSMAGMFNGCLSITSLNLSTFDTSNITTMYGMFLGDSNLESIDLTGWDTSKVADMTGMFANCTSLSSLNVSGFDTSAVTTMDTMFALCSSLSSLNVSNFNTSNVTDMDYMFNGCSSMTALISGDFNISKVTTSTNMFSNCTSLRGSVAYSNSNANDATFANATTGYFTTSLKAYVRTLKDEHNHIIYPQTVFGAVQDTNGDTLTTVITAIYKKIEESAGIIERKTTVITEDGITSISIPFTVYDADNMVIYENGVLINPGMEYTVDESNNLILFNGYTAKTGDVYTFFNRAVVADIIGEVLGATHRVEGSMLYIE